MRGPMLDTSMETTNWNPVHASSLGKYLWNLFRMDVTFILLDTGQ
jgi:hypothetical protein